MNSGIIVGIDLNNTITQAAYYDSKLNNVVSIPEYTNPISLNDLLDMSEGKEANIQGIKDLLVNVLNEICRITNKSYVESLSVVVHDFEIDKLNTIKLAIEKIGLKEDSWQIISSTEGFAYYAFNQKRELYSAGVVLMDYFGEGITMDRLIVQKKDNKDYILQEKEVYSTEDIKAVLRDEKTLDDIATELVFFTNAYFEKRITSAVYLTGKGFDVEKLPQDFSKVIVSKKKAFVGQNLYAKGACYAACEIVRKGVLSDVLMLVEDRIKYGIEVDITVNGQNRRFRIIKAGTNWYMASRTVDFILEDVRNISLKILSPDNTFYEENIDISEIPYREKKTTRISFNIDFTAADRCMITIKDKGFGDFFKSSGKVIYKELEFAN